MNYLAHGIPFLEDPYLLAGTAVPDWLNVADRRVRVRSKYAQPHVDDADPQHAAVARGIVQHHRDDDWFHQTRAFNELTWQFTRQIKQVLPDDEGFRPSFLGHILVEILLDAVLTAQQPTRLEAYYRTLESIDGMVVQEAVNRMAPRRTERLGPLIPLFQAERFLWDYADDAKLWRRLNQVMRRVGLPPLPECFREVLPSARQDVTSRAAELLAGRSNDGSIYQ